MYKNRKIKNATKVQRDGFVFDSKVEDYCHHSLTINRIPFEFQKTYEIQEGFKYNGKKIQNIRIIVDFDLVETRNLIIDTKGWSTPESKIKHKMLKYYFKQKEMNPEIVLLQDRKAVDAYVYKLKNSNIA